MHLNQLAPVKLDLSLTGRNIFGVPAIQYQGLSSPKMNYDEQSEHFNPFYSPHEKSESLGDQLDSE